LHVGLINQPHPLPGWVAALKSAMGVPLQDCSSFYLCGKLSNLSLFLGEERL
jgi:hypothetical protein